MIADRYLGKRLNSPNDIVVHPDGGIWFTDPSYGIRGNYEGFKADSETKEAVYRVDGRTGHIEKVTDELAPAERSLLLGRLQEALHSRQRRVPRAKSGSGTSMARRFATVERFFCPEDP